MKKIYFTSLVIFTILVSSGCTNMITPQPDCYSVTSGSGQPTVICN